METSLIIGLSLMVLGIVVRFYPNIIAGYNTLSKEDKMKINKKALSKYMCKVFIFMGIIFILLDLFLLWINQPMLKWLFHPVIWIVMIVIIFLKSDKFTINK